MAIFQRALNSCSGHFIVKPARLHFARTARALTGRYIASCPNFQPRAHAGLTGLTRHFRLKILAASCSSHFFGQDKRTPGACRSISKTGKAFKVVKCHVTAARVSARIARTDARSVTRPIFTQNGVSCLTD